MDLIEDCGLIRPPGPMLVTGELKKGSQTSSYRHNQQVVTVDLTKAS